MSEYRCREVTLKDGEKIQGTLIPIYPREFLLQTSEMCLELKETEIHALDGEEDFRDSILEPDMRPLGEWTTVYEFDEEGKLSKLDRSRSTNRSDQVLGKLQGTMVSKEGMSKDLEEMFREMEYLDSFGQPLRITVDEELENGWKYSIHLRIPIGPGETYELVSKTPWSHWAEREDDHWIARCHGAITADTVYTVMFLLPPGAELASVAPQPLRQFDFNGRPTVTWKRYMPADEPTTFEATYRLGSE